MSDYLTEAFLRIRERLMWGSMRIVHDTALAEDALQESFVKLWGRYSIRSPLEAEALLQRTVRNTSVDSMRKRKTIPINEELTEVQDDDGKNKENLFLRVEELIMKELNDTQQYIIRRHHYEGVPLDTVAKELGMKPPAVRMQLSRARKTIRDLYNEQEVL